MKVKTIFAILIVISMLITSLGFADILPEESTLPYADDGPFFHRNLSRTPDNLTMGSQMSVMSLYVPTQNTTGEIGLAIDYLAGDCTAADPAGCLVVDTVYEAKPLIVTYEDGVEEVELGTGTAFGQRDAFGALSLDDGATWKDTNLSNAADKSSFTLRNGEAYPGDVFRINHVVVGNRVAVAWISRFCESGSPLYSELPEDQLLLAETYELGNNLTVDGVEYNTYASDLFGVAGSQGSVDYTLQGFPEVGEIPYGCVWVARGTLENVDADGKYDADAETSGIVWRQAERLTSGRRDANRVDITGVGGAGFIVSWQEDPDGLRPGKGLGPGEGWSGAIANSKTDMWYSYIGWDHFDDVCLDDPDTGICEGGTLVDYALDGKAKIAVPFAAPMRLTDNNACKAGVAVDNAGYLPYCYADFDGNGAADLCATSESWTNPGGTTLDICVTEDGRHLTGRTASTRIRWAVKPYTNPDGETSAWVIMAEEKMKALGSELDPVTEDPVDIGKNMWYHTFEWNAPELVQQGLMLNAPAIDHETEDVFPVEVDEWGNEYWETEISRRFNLMVQGNGAAMASESKTSAVLLYKEGILFQGGPADIFMRRVVLPDDFDPTTDNPFAYENVQCVELDDEGVATPADLLYPDGVNPNYVRGLCPEQGMNLSGTAIVECDTTSDPDGCAADFPWDADEDESGYPKVTEWVQTPDNFNDPSWVNPYDVSKGHRGFIDGDFVMMMYATAPNWKANTVGNEAYNLYIRRSFDGGQTWTTLPASFAHIDGETYSGAGTTTCEWYGWGGQVEEATCTDYGPGDFEQARNVSQLTGTRITVLDPRYSPTGGMLKLDYDDLLCYDEAAADGVGDWVNCGYDEASAPYPQEIRDPSAYFVTYETGDNTVVTEETATVPLDMYYSKAYNFGDEYGALELTTSSGQLVLRWDWLENGPDLATEASVYGNPDGSKFYAVWNQELPIGDDHFTNMDSEFRRIFYYLDEDETTAIDVYPSASILYVSTDKADYDDEDIILVGSARDHDKLGEGDDIQSQGWWVTIQEDSHFYEGRTFQRPPNGFIPGKHDFSFVAQDNEGNWTRPKTVTIWIAEQFYDTYLPLITH